MGGVSTESESFVELIFKKFCQILFAFVWLVHLSGHALIFVLHDCVIHLHLIYTPGTRALISCTCLKLHIIHPNNNPKKPFSIFYKAIRRVFFVLCVCVFVHTHVWPHHHAFANQMFTMNIIEMMTDESKATVCSKILTNNWIMVSVFAPKDRHV